MAAKDDRYNIDDIGWKIIEELQKNARISFKQLAENVNLSTTATVERVRNMEDAGISAETDFCDPHHLNVSGATKMADYLGAYLKENYDLTDWREVPGNLWENHS